jgi:hypothetical protein
MKREATQAAPPAADVPAVASQDTPRRPTTAQVVLGLFICWQLFFLAASNVLSLANTVRDEDYQESLPPDSEAVIRQALPGWLEKKGHVYHLCDFVTKLTERWGELLGQPQSWSLFAPEISKGITFVGMRLRWDDPDDKQEDEEDPVPHPEVFLRSANEPENPRSFFRLGHFRLRKYESYLDVVLKFREKEEVRDGHTVKRRETPEEAVERWRDNIKDKVNKEWDTIPAYFRMRYREFRDAHPDVPPPRQVILVVRRYAVPDPEEFSEAWYEHPLEVPIARCLVSVVKENGGEKLDWGDVEWFNPTKIDKDGKVLAGHYETTGNEDEGDGDD